MKFRYLLLALSATALSSCATYKAMRMDPNQRVTQAEETEEEPALPELNEDIQLPDLNQAPQPVAQPQRQAPSNKQQRRDTGNFMVPDTFTLPSQSDLQETATSTQKTTTTPSLTVPTQ